MLEGPAISQGRLEAPEPEARIYAYIKGDAEARIANVLASHLTVTNLSSYTLVDSCATHSFISTIHANRLDKVKDVISQTFRTSLHLEDVLISTH